MRQHNLTPDSSVNQSEDTKKHNTAKTSIESFKVVNESGQRIREKKRVLDFIRENQPVTSRMISQMLSVERGNITRSLNDLVNDSPALIKVAYEDKCPVTKRKVQWYTLIEWPQMQLFTA